MMQFGKETNRAAPSFILIDGIGHDSCCIW